MHYKTSIRFKAEIAGTYAAGAGDRLRIPRGILPEEAYEGIRWIEFTNISVVRDLKLFEEGDDPAIRLHGGHVIVARNIYFLVDGARLMLKGYLAPPYTWDVADAPSRAKLREALEALTEAAKLTKQLWSLVSSHYPAPGRDGAV